MTWYSSKWTNRRMTVLYLSSKLFNDLVNMPWTIQTYFTYFVFFGYCLHVFYHQKSVQSYKKNLYHKTCYLKMIKLKFSINIDSCLTSNFLKFPKNTVFQNLSFLNCII
eukprot:373852_1